MAKKQKSKARLDKYYYLAKEHGFRSRAAFKLIQLNKKYNFLGSANCLIDLCAAPGGWLQVAAKYMPVSSIKIGVDLDPIKPINGVTHFQADITSEKCRFLIKKEIKHFKADVVLNDGAPNVGGQWSKDAYNQSELVLFALKLATEFLREDGIFITKVFRSSDYNSLLYVLKQLFKKVEATKPQASRNESAEIFVVCQGYRAPAYIDSKLLDPKYALKQLEDEEDMKMNSIKSIKAMFDQKKSRGGYSGKLYNEKSFKDFIESANPYQFLTENNKIKILTDDCKKYLQVMKCPMDYKLYFEDLLILGKKEIQELIIWRNKIKAKVTKKDKAAEKAEADAEDIELNDEEKVADKLESYKERKLKELEEEEHKIEKSKKKKLEQEKKKKEKNELHLKMSFVNEQEVGQGNDIEFDQQTFDFIRKHNINIEELAYTDTDKPITIPKQDIDEVDLSDLSDMDYVEMMNEDIEENMRLFAEKKSLNKKKEKREKKKKFERENEEEIEPKKISDGIDYVKGEDAEQNGESGKSEAESNDSDNKDDSILDNEEADEEQEDEDEEEEMEYEEDSDAEFINKNKILQKPKNKQVAEVSSDSDEQGQDDITGPKTSKNTNTNKKNNLAISNKRATKEESEEDVFENPLRKKKNLEKMNKSKFEDNTKNKDKNNANANSKKFASDESENENNLSSDTDEENNNKKANKNKNLEKSKNNINELKLLGKKTSRDTDADAKADKNQDNKIDLVPKHEDSDSENMESEYDTDEKAEIRAIAKKMLRKKDRLDILYKTYNRYAFDDIYQAPEWFADEELKHNKPVAPVTKEEINTEREALREFNSRMPKKILEAKARKKNKLAKRLDKVKKKAQAISNQDDINEFSKVKQIEKLYRKEINKSKEKKKYVVARANRRNMGKNSRNVKMVDRRLKKDSRALKRAEKRNKKKGVARPRGKGKKGGRR